jgi:hypothetical protein
MHLKENYNRIDPKDRRQPPPTPGPLDSVSEQIDRLTHSFRKWTGNQIGRAINDLDSASQASSHITGLTRHYKETASQLYDLRQRVLAGGVGGLMASGSAVIQCLKLRTLGL